MQAENRLPLREENPVFVERAAMSAIEEKVEAVVAKEPSVKLGELDLGFWVANGGSTPAAIAAMIAFVSFSSFNAVSVPSSLRSRPSFARRSGLREGGSGCFGGVGPW